MATVIMSDAVLDSIKLAGDGLNSAASERHDEAINLFTQAIRLYDKDFRYFVNRSYCYYYLKKFDLSLADAEAGIKIDPNHPKPHYRLVRLVYFHNLLNMVLTTGKDWLSWA